MKAKDARRHSPEKLEVLRERGFAMRREGYRVVEIAKALGVVRGTVYKWFRNAEASTEEQATVGGRRGRPQGVGAKLTPAQEAEIRRYVVSKNPKQLKFDFALWTRRAVRALIKRLYRIDLSLSRVGVYLHRWGLSVQRPSRHAIEQDTEKVRQWKLEEYPAIAARAKVEGAIIYWADETAIKHDSNWVTGYSPRGCTPTVECYDGRWKTATMVSAISNQGLLRFKVQDKPMNQDSFVEFLGDLIADEERKVFLIVDNLRVHKSKVVKQWAEEHKDRIELFFLPPYSPEINPDEYVNRALKTELRSRAPAPIDKLKERTHRFMAKMSKSVSKIRKIFENKHVRYAAEFC
ncbi:MAG TPA: IS630 family transposase [Candidatus Aphodousia gallistercoris]|nr:IS630 family transposase [Candidatus Aphodousia gallistercoris]